MKFKGSENGVEDHLCDGVMISSNTVTYFTVSFFADVCHDRKMIEQNETTGYLWQDFVAPPLRTRQINKLATFIYIVPIINHAANWNTKHSFRKPFYHLWSTQVMLERIVATF